MGGSKEPQCGRFEEGAQEVQAGAPRAGQGSLDGGTIRPTPKTARGRLWTPRTEKYTPHPGRRPEWAWNQSPAPRCLARGKSPLSRGSQCGPQHKHSSVLYSPPN